MKRIKINLDKETVKQVAEAAKTLPEFHVGRVLAAECIECFKKKEKMHEKNGEYPLGISCFPIDIPDLVRDYLLTDGQVFAGIEDFSEEILYRFEKAETMEVDETEQFGIGEIDWGPDVGSEIIDDDYNHVEDNKKV